MKSDKTKRQLQAEQTKQKLFETAIKEFETRGYCNVAVEDICKKCGVSKGTFYVHYKSKEDIIKLNLAQKMSAIRESLTTFSSEDSNSSAPEKLTHFLYSFFDLMQEVGTDTVRSIFVLEPSSGSGTANIDYKDFLFLPDIKAIISNGVESGSLNKNLSQEVLLMYLVSFLIGTLYMWCNNEKSFPLIPMSKMIVPSFVKGISE